MKNFKEDDSFVQKIEIINPEKLAQEKSTINKKEYDIQFLTEGGRLISDVRSFVGIKVLNYKGRGTSAKGYILNDKGEEVSEFKTNFLGIGKFSFLPKKGQNYTARITLSNSKEIALPLPKINLVGISISVNNLRGDKTFVSLQTNQITLDRLSNNNYKLLIHKNGASRLIPISLDALSKTITINKKELSYGIYIITLFDANQKPILERMFFNSKQNIQKQVSLEEIKIEGDSIIYQLKPKELDKKNTVHLSVSVLPTQTKSYKPIHNIISAFHLKPYLRGKIEQPQYYINTINDKKRVFDLDNLLITQGWSKYDWINIFLSPPKALHIFENGITIKGRINRDLKKIKSFFLYPSELNTSRFIDVYSNGDFYLKNFYPIKGEVIKFSYSNRKNKMKNPKLALSYDRQLGVDRVDTSNYRTFTSYYANKNMFQGGFFAKNTEKLDEVVIKVDLERKKNTICLLEVS